MNLWDIYSKQNKLLSGKGNEEQDFMDVMLIILKDMTHVAPINKVTGLPNHPGRS
jgi:hypothetical protein